MASRIWYRDSKHGWLLGNVESGTASTGYLIVSADCNPNAVCYHVFSTTRYIHK